MLLCKSVSLIRDFGWRKTAIENRTIRWVWKYSRTFYNVSRSKYFVLLFIRESIVPLLNVFREWKLLHQQVFASSKQKHWFAMSDASVLEIVIVSSSPLIDQKSDDDQESENNWQHVASDFFDRVDVLCVNFVFKYKTEFYRLISVIGDKITTLLEYARCQYVLNTTYLDGWTEFTFYRERTEILTKSNE